MICPNCELENPSGALRCDCGYEFHQRSTPEPVQGADFAASGVTAVFWVLTILGVEALSGPAKSAIAGIYRSASLQIVPLTAMMGESPSRDRLLATLSVIFGALALMLAMMGLYGVMSYNVARRRNEIAIRMALGAEQARVVRMVLTEVLLIVGSGLAVGLALAMAMTRFVASFLYGLTPNDPLTLSLATAALAGAAVIAGYLPARRASRVDPMTALPEE